MSGFEAWIEHHLEQELGPVSRSVPPPPRYRLSSGPVLRVPRTAAFGFVLAAALASGGALAAVLTGQVTPFNSSPVSAPPAVTSTTSAPATAGSPTARGRAGATQHPGAPAGSKSQAQAKSSSAQPGGVAKGWNCVQSGVTGRQRGACASGRPAPPPHHAAGSHPAHPAAATHGKGSTPKH